MATDKKDELEKKDRRGIKTLAAGLGAVIAGVSWVLFGPIGLFIGGSCGIAAALKFIKAADEAMKEDRRESRAAGSGGQATGFRLSLLVLASMVMRADGHITRGELDEFKDFWKSNFGESQTLEALQILKRMVQQDSDYMTICRQISEHMSYSARLELLHFLLRIAAADYLVNSEVNLITRMAAALGVSQADYLSILQGYLHRSEGYGETGGGYRSEQSRQRGGGTSQGSLQWAYNVLQITESATDDEVKKAYRRMAMKYHPDKVASLGEGVRLSATEKFKDVNKAYECVKRARGIK